MTRKLLLLAASSALAAAASPAFAQSAFDGFYVGANIGGSWGDTNARTDVTNGGGTTGIAAVDIAAIAAANRVDDDSDGGFAGGVQGGFNWSSGSWLFGVETDISAIDISETSTAAARSPLPTTPPVDYTLVQEIKADWLWTLRPRVGYVSGPWLVFGSFGVAVSDVDYNVNFRDTRTPANVLNASFSDTRTGWAGSLGAAYAFNDQWSFTGEWMYADLGSIDGTVVTPNGFVALRSDTDVRTNLFRVGANFRF